MDSNLKVLQTDRIKDYEEDLLLEESSKGKKTASNWALSYGDIVTVLLCFFIIFYAIEKQMEQRKKNPIKVYSKEEGILKEHRARRVDAAYDFMIESLGNIPNIQLKKTSTFVDIYFEEVVFFEKGSSKLTTKGKTLIQDVLARLNKIKNVYRVEIQGHADKTPVKKTNTYWWKTNMELSVLRALSVYRHMITNDIPKEYLAVTGFGTHKRINPDFDKIMDTNRRISLRLQLIE